MEYKSHLYLKQIAERRRSWLDAKNRDIIVAYEIDKTNADEKPFAYGICAYKLFWLFVIGGILGFIFETVWCLLTTGHFEMRTSLVIGMFIPVYGFGAIILTLSLHRLYRSRDLWIFLGSSVIGGVIEYFCSLFQEMTFDTVSWDYSKTQFNLGGRTNLMFSFVWGILGIIWIKDWYPGISKFIEKIPKKQGKLLTFVVLIALVIDMLLSAFAVTRKVERFYDKTPSSSFDVFLDKNFNDAYLKLVFPHMEICLKHK